MKFSSKDDPLIEMVENIVGKKRSFRLPGTMFSNAAYRI